MGSFTYYIDKFLTFFDHLHLSPVDIGESIPSLVNKRENLHIVDISTTAYLYLIL